MHQPPAEQRLAAAGLPSPAALACMRELFVYYRVAPGAADTARAAVMRMQQALQVRHPALIARLLCRTDNADSGLQTWMETYATDGAGAPHGITADLEAAIDLEAQALLPWITGPRYTEAFGACAW